MLLGLDIATWSIMILVVMVGLLVIGVPLGQHGGHRGRALPDALRPQSLFLIGSRTFTFLDSYTLVSVPFFIYMACILERSGLAADSTTR